VSSISQVYIFLMFLWTVLKGVPDVLAYDDACHLAMYVINLVRFMAKSVYPLQRLFVMWCWIVVDPFHYKGHKKEDVFCVEHCNPGNVAGLKGTNMEVRTADTNLHNGWIVLPPNGGGKSEERNG
jgi:hypothetical protein